MVGGSARQLVPDQLLVDLANAGFRNVFHEVNLPGNGPLVDVATVHKLLQVLLDVFQPDVLAGFQGNQGIGSFAPFLIRHTHHGGTGNGRMLADQVFQVQVQGPSGPVSNHLADGFASASIRVLSGAVPPMSSYHFMKNYASLIFS